MRPEDTEGISVIVRCCFERRDLRLTKVDADRVVRPAALFAPCSESLGQCALTTIVEAHAVDERLVSDGPEHARLRIARLRVPRHTAQPAESETKRPPDRDGSSLLVHSGSEADGVRKALSKEAAGQLLCAVAGFHQLAERRLPRHETKSGQGAIVNLFRWL